jgi:GTP-binding protein LepA
MTDITTSHIRNFSIIAHIDHGKSTLADRLLQKTGTVAERDMTNQMLDSMDLEREKGITIKARAVRMAYTAADGEEYELNLIDTPGHVDFSYEVSRSLAACEGALLVVDAAQGIEAQTMANVYLAMEHDLAIIAVINKIDLPNADPERVAHEVGQFIGLLDDEVIPASAKTGVGIDGILEAIVQKMPPPAATGVNHPARALIFDSHYDAFKGVIAYVKIVDGEIRTTDRMRVMGTKKEADILELGYFGPGMTTSASLRTVRWATSPPGSRSSRIVRLATPSPSPPIPPQLRSLAIGRPSRWSSPGSIRPTPKTSRSSAMRWSACNSTTRR